MTQLGDWAIRPIPIGGPIGQDGYMNTPHLTTTRLAPGLYETPGGFMIERVSREARDAGHRDGWHERGRQWPLRGRQILASVVVVAAPRDSERVRHLGRLAPRVYRDLEPVKRAAPALDIGFVGPALAFS